MSAPQPPAEAQAQGDRKVWDEDHDLLLRAIASQLRKNGNAVQARVIEAAASALAARTAPPSAPVGVRSDGATQCGACGGWNLPGCEQCCPALSAPVGVDLDKVAAHLAEHGGDFDALIRLVQEAALAQQPAAADGADTRRLDWLDGRAHCADWDTGGREVMRRVIRADDGEEFCADTWREAIDMALAAQPGGSDRE
ncbi:hypothetical protein H9645_03790 [Luteimonas sp. Sa2BVA3]|uniref:Uncharacterized protein n=1 Tax=Luteimonas colneyensis TaxID=2762230 RepID=A0ABR8UGJ0_9GAMM|nr:hypothetical protein [Luteimonas colneyensis]MBD7987144.1 hypothetical protein [Luteimonas colneyensis]